MSQPRKIARKAKGRAELLGSGWELAFPGKSVKVPPQKHSAR